MAFYGIDYPVKPIVYDFPRTADFLKFMDQYGIERSLVMSNYGIPKPEQPFSLNPVVMGGPHRPHPRPAVGLLPARDREHTVEALSTAARPGSSA